ncbi:MAG: peptidase domain-containing ABC transporter [Pseudomonadota bacterium]
MIFGASGRVRLVRQAEAAECGLACVVMIAGAYGRHVDLCRARHAAGVSLRGATAADVMEIAASHGLASRALRLEPEAMHHLRLPAVLHMDMSHFVVLERVGRRSVTLCDPARGRVRVSRTELARRFSGVAMEFAPTDGFEAVRDTSRLRLTDLWSSLRGAWRAGAQILALTLLLQVTGLVAPLYLQIVVDEVLVKGDIDLAAILALGFGATVVFAAFSKWLHGTALLGAGAAVEAQTTINVFSHLLRLPTDWFERRNVGDVLSRLDSLNEVSQFLSERLISAMVDLAFALALIAILWLYEPRLAAITLGALALTFLIRLVLHTPLKRRGEQALIAAATKETHTIETLRGVASIRMAAGEERRRQSWLNLHAADVDAGLRLGRLELSAKTVNELILGLEMVLVVYVAARLSLSGEFTVGMLLAFMAYRDQTTRRVASVIDHIMTFLMLRLHLDRLADVVTAEPDRAPPAAPAAVVAGGRPLPLSLHGAGLRYGPRMPWVFEGLDFTLKPGARVAINGPSGCGKSSLLRVLLGMTPPSAGEARWGGRLLEGPTLAQYRCAIGAVLQEDALFSGTLAENITFFDPSPDLDRVSECARIAEIDADIEAMPMRYDSLVGDMGAALSGGQKQRVLIARALYRRPSILVLDEGTAHLDPEREDRIFATLRRLEVSLLFVAHRETTLHAADEVYSMTPGGLVVSTNATRTAA